MEVAGWNPRCVPTDPADARDRGTLGCGKALRSRGRAQASGRGRRGRILPTMVALRGSSVGVEEAHGWSDLEEIELLQLPSEGEPIETKFGTLVVERAEKTPDSEKYDGKIVCPSPLSRGVRRSGSPPGPRRFIPSRTTTLWDRVDR